MSRSGYRSIGSQIQSQRNSSRASSRKSSREIVTEAQLKKKAFSLLQKPIFVKVQKDRKEGIIKPLKLADQLRQHFNLNSTNFAESPEPSEPNKCFEIDFDWLEYCDENSFRQIFSEDLSKIDDIERYVEDNQMQLFHIFGQCACAKCTCNQCYCPMRKQDLVYHAGLITTNKFDYQPKNLNLTFWTPIINQSHYDNLRLSNAQGKFNTTQRDTYKWFTPTAKNKSHSLHQKPRLGNIGKTLNNLTFIDWKCYKNQDHMKAPVHKSTVGGQLLDVTSYKNDFIWRQAQKPVKASDNDLRKTFSRPYNIPMMTSYQQNYGNKSALGPVQNFKQLEVYTPSHSFDGQYRTTSQLDYQGKRQPQEVVHQRPWKSKLIKILQNNK